MQIEPQQFDAFLQQDLPAYVDRILKTVRAQYPTLRQTDEMLRDSIRAGIRRARDHGLGSDQQVMEYVLVMFACAPNFDQQAQIAQALGDVNASPSERWERIFSEAFDDAWFEADQPAFYDERFWVDPDELAAREQTPPAVPPSEDDWADLVIALREAQSPSAQAPGPTSEHERAEARAALSAAVARNSATSPAGWDDRARAAAEQLRLKATRGSEPR